MTAIDLQSPAYRMAFREWFGLPRAEADILISLYIARGAFVTAQTLADLAGTRGPAAIPQRVSKVRTALNTEALDSVKGSGYRLTDDGLAECRAALWTMGEELRRAV